MIKQFHPSSQHRPITDTFNQKFNNFYVIYLEN